MVVACPDCGTQLRIPETSAGKRPVCPKCVEAVSAEIKNTEPKAALGPEPVGHEGDAEDQTLNCREHKPARKRRIVPWLIPGIVGLLLLAGGIVILVIMLGPGKSSAYKKAEEFTDKILEQFNVVCDAIESVQDEQSARAAAVKINQACDRLSDILEEWKNLPTLNQEEENQLRAKWQPQVKTMDDRLRKVVAEGGVKYEEDPNFNQALVRFAKINGLLNRQAGRPGNSAAWAPSSDQQKSQSRHNQPSAPLEWQMIAEDDFSVELPDGTVTRKTRGENGPLLYMKVQVTHTKQFWITFDEIGNRVMFFPIESNRAAYDKYLDNAVTKASKSAGTKILEQRPITLGRFPGRELRTQSPEGDLQRWRIYASEYRVYTLLAGWSDELGDTSEGIDRFLDSFKLVDPIEVEKNNKK